MTIYRLSEETINQIAAGEVVENPASVVKELIENSVDAKASSIEIEILGGGFSKIKVSDNGSGMTQEDALLSLERHATSKIVSAADLQGLSTMGFRGEALAAISAISRLTLTTATHEGIRIVAEGGKIVKITPYPRSKGTTIEVSSLFFNVPARRKFQKSAAASFAEIHRMIIVLALAHPEVSFRLTHEEEIVLESAAASFEKRSIELIGSFFSQASVIQHPQFRGLLAPISETRVNRLGQYIFVNRRPVLAPSISMAVKEGYGTSIDVDRHPVFLLYLDMPASEVDVNVHPQKKEVRFREEASLKANLSQVVASTLGIRSSSPMTLPSWNPSSSHPITSSFVIRDEPVERATPLFQDSPHVLGLFAHFLLLLEEESLKVVDLKMIYEKVMFESLSSETASQGQGLLIPLIVELSPEEEGLVQEKFDLFKKAGFALHSIGKRQWMIDTIPPFLESCDAIEVFKQSLDGDVTKILVKTAQIKKTTFVLQEALKLYQTPHAKQATRLWSPDEFQKVLRLS